MSTYRDPWMKKAKWLTQALIISCTINVGLLCTFIYFAMTDNNNSLTESSTITSTAKENLTIHETITKYSTLSFQDLLLRLNNNEHVESGCTRRDLALACLVAFHHFNLERALGGLALQKREITYIPPGGDPTTLIIFPGLADYQFQAIVSYAKTEKWPLNSKGLFLELQKSRPPFDPTLLETFYLTPEFHYISLLFSKTGINVKKEYIAALLAGANWSILSETTEHLRLNNAFTPEERRHFLLRLVEIESKLAAKILLEADQEFCYKQLDNQQVLTLCTLLGEKTPSAFLRALLESPRSDEIWKLAAAILYEQAAEEKPEELNLDAAKSRFLDLKPTSAPTPQRPKPKKTGKTYTVKTGDSLWKIARDQNTTVKALREANHLESDRLKIGQSLIIP